MQAAQEPRLRDGARIDRTKAYSRRALPDHHAPAWIHRMPQIAGTGVIELE